jgi:hypothetical protein
MRTTREATSPGVEKKNGGSSVTPKIFTDEPSHHRPIATAPTRVWRARSFQRFMGSPPRRS